MNTRIYDLTKENNTDKIYLEASHVINSGGLVVFPTETVYGLGANAFDNDAVAKIFEVKNRPKDNPLIVHISDFKMLKNLTTEITNDAMLLMQNFFPGALTLVMKKSDKVPDNVSNGLNTVAVRMPSHKIAQNLIKASQTPIAAPSANISKRPSITSAKHVVEELNGKVDMILCADSTPIGIESTVLDVTTEKVKLLRPGGIPVEEIENILGKPISIGNKDDALAPKSPGMKYSHYKPRTKVYALKGDDSKIIPFLIKKAFNLNIGFIGFNETISKIDTKEIKTLSLGDDTKTASKTLFYNLREMDKENLGAIYVQATDTEGLGLAFMNRLLKSADGDIINL